MVGAREEVLAKDETQGAMLTGVESSLKNKTATKGELRIKISSLKLIIILPLLR